LQPAPTDCCGTPAAARDRFLSSCETVELKFAAVVCVEGKPLEDVYFPTDSVISLVSVLADGARLEVGIIATRACWELPSLWG
jgi:hypothetical protein